MWTFTIFWFNIYDNFDCAYIFDYTYILLYNLAFTSLPIIFMGILDQDVDDKISLAVPQLYRRGIERKEWTQLKFWYVSAYHSMIDNTDTFRLYMLDGAYQSVICFFLPYLLFSYNTFNTESGQTVNDYKQFGVYIANAIVVVVNVYFLLNTYRWDWFMLLMSAFSILLIFFWTGVYSSFSSAFTFYGAARHCYGSLSFWTLTFLTIIVCLLPRFAIKAFQKVFMPRDVDIVREQVRRGQFDYLKNIDPAHATAIDHEKAMHSASSSDVSKSHNVGRNKASGQDDDSRPIYPPSVTNTYEQPYSPKGSDGTLDYNVNRSSLDRAVQAASVNGYHLPAHNRHSSSYATASQGTPHVYGHETLPTITHSDSQTSGIGKEGRPSFTHDRLRQSFELSPTRLCYGDSDDFTSMASLARAESAQSRSQSRTRERDSRDFTSMGRVP